MSERAAAAGALHEALLAALGGRGRLVLVTGEAGIGKTTLVRDAAADARTAGARAVWSACWPDESVAHAPWRAVLPCLGEGGARAAATLGAATSAHDPAAAVAGRAAAYQGVVDVLADAAREEPLVLVFDDLHWADEATIHLLAAVRGQLPALAVLIVGTYRDDEVAHGAPLARLASSADRVTLMPLGRARTREILASVVDHDLPDETVDTVMRRTGGNPFLVVQLARLLASGVDAVLPAGARDVLQYRLGLLPDDVRAVLAAAAVLAAPTTVEQLAAVTDLGIHAVLGALDRAATARVVEPGPGSGRWSFVHDLFRVATLDALPAARRVALHRRCAAVLATDGAEPAVVAHHLLAATTGPDTDAADWSLRAGRTALDARAWEEAAAHAERALGALPPGAEADELRADAWLLLGRARLCTADRDATTAAFMAAAALARSLDSPALLARAALGFAADLAGFEVQLFDQRQIDLLEEAAQALAHADDPPLRARVLARLSVALSFVAPTERRLALAEQAVALARAVDDPLVLAGALAAHCDAIAGPSDTERRLVEADEIVALARSANDAGLELLGRRLRVVALLELGDLTSANDEMRSFALRAEETGNPLYRWYVALWRGMWALANGDLAATERCVEEAERMGADAGSANAPMLAAVLRAELLYQARRTDETSEMFKRIGDVLGELADSVQAAGNMARFALTLGRDVAAHGTLDRVAAVGVGAMPRDAEFLPGVATMLDAAARAGHPVLADAVAVGTPYAHRFAFEGIGAAMHGSLARFLAVAHLRLGEHDRAVAFARQALDANRGAGRLVVAHSQRVLADTLDAVDDASGEAARLHAAADAAFDAMGLGHLVRRPTTQVQSGAADDDAAFVRDGDVWRISYRGATTILRHSKGLADLAVLLSRPGREVHVTELERLPEHVGVAARATGGDSTLDRRALSEYRARLATVETELAEAEDAHDIGRAERARAERDFLVDELAGAVGLHGRGRAVGPDPVERLRKAVTARVRDAIRHIDAAHPVLGRHLANAVRTGTYCSYVPEQPLVWRCETRTGASRA